MLTFAGPVEAFTALQDFMIDRTAALPEPLRDEIRKLLRERSTVVSTVRAIEAVYARQSRCEDVPAEMLDWAAGAATMADARGFRGMTSEGRGAKIAIYLRGEPITVSDRPLVRAELAQRMDPEALNS